MYNMTLAERASLYYVMMDQIKGFTSEGKPVAGWTKPTITLGNFKMRRCFERLVGDPEILLRHGGGNRVMNAAMWESGADPVGIGTTAFLKVTGELIGNKVIESYDIVTGVADQLVENLPTKFRTNNYPGFDSLQASTQVDEGQPFDQLGFQEKFVGSNDTHKYGGIVALTKEAIFHDQTDMLILRASQVGRDLKYLWEKLVIDSVQDFDKGGTANLEFLPNGAAEALYRTSTGTNSTTVNKAATNGLGDYTNIDAAIQVFIGMRDETSQAIPVPSPLTLLVPEALMDVASVILNPISIHLNNDGGSTFGTQVGMGGGLHAVRSVQSVLSSVHLDAKAAGTWYLGNFQRQFKWREHWPLSVETGDNKLDAFFLRDIAFAIKASFYGGMLVLDDKYVVQSTVA